MHGESDFLPGLVIDRFDDILVVQINTQGMAKVEADIIDALDKVVRPRVIVMSNDTSGRRMEGLPLESEVVRGELPEDGLGPLVRRGLGSAQPSWLSGHGWGLGAEGLRAPNPASPRRRTRGEWVSGTGDPQQSSRAQGAGAAQPRFALWREGVRGRKRLALLSRSEARWGCGLLPEESFPLQNAADRRLFRAVGATGPRR